MKPMPRSPSGGIAAYRKVGVASSVESATPHKLIEMLMDGALEKIQIAKACMGRKEIAKKCEAIDWTLNILGGLQGSLDMERGGDVANNLSNLYDYMMRRLVEANTVNDPAVLEEVSRLMGEIREAWIAIRN